MRINSISADYGALRAKNVRGAKVSEPQTPSTNLPEGMSMISFKSGNPRHIAHIVMEEPLFGFSGGGVGTVSNDYNFLDKNVDKVVKFIPLYNQEVEYKKDFDQKTGKERAPLAQKVEVRYVPQNLPADHPLKGQEGSAFVTSKPIDKTTDLVEFLKKEKKNVFLLDEVKSSEMSWGTEENVPIKMFKVRKNDTLKDLMTNKKYSKELQDKLEFVFTFVDSTASMPKPYADGMSYASSNGTDLEKRFASGWKGQEYVKFDKALVELMPGLKEKYNIDPRYILCSDGQSMFTMHYAAQKNAAGDSYWLDKFLGGVGHNMNAGYDQLMGARQAIVNLGATKEQIKKLVESKEYIDALRNGEEEKFLQETVLKNFYKEKSGMNAFMVPIHYGMKGYVPMFTTVSEGYHDSTITNPLISSLYEDLKELDKLGRYKGLTNPLMDPTVSGYLNNALSDGYKKEVKVKLADGSVVDVQKFLIFDKNKKGDVKHIREIKHQNKISIFERFSSKFIGSQLFNQDKNEWGAVDSGRLTITAGRADKPVKIYGAIKKDYVTKLKKGEDVKLIVSWGRGDLQKGMDTVIDSFVKYVEKTKDPNAVLIMGGPMENDEAKAVVEKFKSLMYRPDLEGRMVLMDGWTPGKDLSLAGDVALLPSRFAPCELTDLEAKKYHCTPVVPNVQGMAQKNFDPSIPAEAKLADGYKGKHEFYMTEEEAFKSANENAQKEFKAIKDKLVSKIKKDYQGVVGDPMPEELFKSTLEGNGDYKKALRTLRDSVISDEMADCLERALIKDRDSSIAETIYKNQLKDTTWFGNGWLSKTGKHSGDLYWDWHFNNKGKNISKEDLIQLDFSGLHEAPTSTQGGSKINKLKAWMHSHKKAAIITGSVIGLAGLGYAGYKAGWLSPKFRDEKKHGHLSCMG